MMAAAPSSVCEWALAYASLGWHVLPVGRDKKPLGGFGLASATTDATKIRAWFERWPEAQVAIACKPSRLVVLDCDLGHEEGVDGVETLHALAGANPIGAVLVASTPRGGRHFFFSQPPGEEIRSRKVRPGIDVKAGGGEHGGYVLVPCGVPGREWIEGDPWSS